MHDFKVGVIIDSFRLDIFQGIKKASQMGAEGIQIGAVEGEMDPDNLTTSKRKELSDLIKSCGLSVSALCGDLGGHGFENAEDNIWKIEKSKRIIDLALDLDCNIVTTHIGVIPEDPSSPKRHILQAACEALGDYAVKSNAFFAIETGPEKSDTLKSFLQRLDTNGVKVNMDPANLVMVTDEDPVKSVYVLKDHIVHTHVKDGIMLKKTDPEIIYNYFAEGGIEDLHLEEYFLETPLGEGSVDFDAYFDALKNIGYKGYLTVEREVGDDPVEDIIKAVRFIKERI